MSRASAGSPTSKPCDGGVTINFKAHDELLDDLIRRFEEWVERAHEFDQSSQQERTGKTTVRVGSNIAFIKYWGVIDETINIPLSNSISMTLADAHTTTTVSGIRRRIAWNRMSSALTAASVIERRLRWSAIWIGCGRWRAWIAGHGSPARTTSPWPPALPAQPAVLPR